MVLQKPGALVEIAGLNGSPRGLLYSAWAYGLPRFGTSTSSVPLPVAGATGMNRITRAA